MLTEKDYALLDFIIKYTLKNKVPPTIDSIINETGLLKSKSSVYNHLQKLCDYRLLEQKNILGIYYPTGLIVIENSEYKKLKKLEKNKHVVNN